jgi:hypothetical protein
MPLYEFRLRLNFSEAYRIGSDLDQLELLVLPHGEKLTVRSNANDTPIKNHASVAIIGGLYNSENQARTAAEKSKRSLLYWAIEQRVGIDFGDREQRSGVTSKGLEILQNNYGCPVRNDIHGIDVYEHVEKQMFVKVEGKGTLSKSLPKLIDTFRREYLNSRRLREKQVLACEIYTSSFFDGSPRSRFITLVTAIEALLDPPKRSAEVQALVTEFVDTTNQQSMIDEPTKASIIGSLDNVRCQSIGQAGRTLACRLLPDQYFVFPDQYSEKKSSADFFKDCYDMRSRILHDGKISDASVDIVQLANNMESFVHHLLIAVLSSEPQQDTVAEISTES